jgi:hypothetical protein
MALCCLVRLLLSTEPARPDPRRPENNLERLLAAADSAAVLCAGNFGFLPGERIQWIEEKNTDELGRFLMTRFAAGLAWNGIRLCNPGKALPGTAGLFLAVGKASVRYETPAMPGSPGEAPILRIAEIELKARLERSDTVLVDTVSVRLDDRIARSDLETVERGSFSGMKTEKPESGSWFRMIVPALIVASVGWMVYSFYSIRSQ